jgi:carbon monoxide dehydrogenase subunit G
VAQGEAQIDIDQPADAVWALVRDFGGIGTWMPGIDRCTVSGSDRTLSLMGMEIVERDYGVDDATRSASYGIVGGGLAVDHHRATITVSERPNGCHVRWAFDVQPDTLAPLMAQTYQGALEALAKHLTAS